MSGETTREQRAIVQVLDLVEVVVTMCGALNALAHADNDPELESMAQATWELCNSLRTELREAFGMPPDGA